MDLVPCLPQLVMENKFIPCLSSLSTSLDGKREGSSLPSQGVAGHNRSLAKESERRLFPHGSAHGNPEGSAPARQGARAPRAGGVPPGLAGSPRGWRGASGPPRRAGGSWRGRGAGPAVRRSTPSARRRRRGACKRLCCRFKWAKLEKRRRRREILFGQSL